MMSLTDILVLIGMFALRFGVPLAIVMGLGYLLKRLDRRWEKEARAQQHAAQVTEQPAKRPGGRPIMPIPAPRKKSPTPKWPFVPPPSPAHRPKAYLQQAAPLGVERQMASGQSALRCCDFRACDESVRSQCPATYRPDIPCWQARMQAEGHMPDECATCEVFQRYPTM